MIHKKLIELYQKTYKHKSFRDMMFITRVFVLLMDTLLVAFFANLYISGIINEAILIVLMILTTIFFYIFIFKYVYHQHHHYSEKKFQLNLNKFNIYLIIEAILFSSILIYVYFYIKSIYL